MYGVSMENLQPAEQWLDAHARILRNLVCGEWLLNDSGVSSSQHSVSGTGATFTVQKCSAQLVQELASKCLEKSKQPANRSDVSKFLKLLLSVIEQQTSLLVGLETMASGRVVSEIRAIDLASWQQSVKSSIAECDGERSTQRTDRGLVCSILRSTNTPLLTCLAELSSALAHGNFVLLLSDRAFATALLALFDTLMTGPQAALAKTVLARVSVLHCDTASLAVRDLPVSSMDVREIDSLRLPCTTGAFDPVSSREHRARSIALVFEDSDVRAAANSVVDSFLLANGQHTLCARLIYVQQPVYASFMGYITERCSRIRVGAAADRNIDIRALHADEIEIDPKTLAFVTATDAVRPSVSEADGKLTPVFLRDLPNEDLDCLAPAGPICLVLPFRTPFDAISLCSQRALGVRDAALSLFTADFALAYELARRLPRFSAVLVNSGARLYLPSLLSFASRPTAFQLTRLRPVEQPAATGVESVVSLDAARACNTKLLVGGKLTASDSARVASVQLADNEHLTISVASATDVRSAIDAARSALNSSGWGRKSLNDRATVVSSMVDVVLNGAADFFSLLVAMAKDSSDSVAIASSRNHLTNAVANIRRFVRGSSLPSNARFGEESLGGPLQSIVIRQTVPVGVLTIVVGDAVCDKSLAASTRRLVVTLASVCSALLGGNAVVLVAADLQTLLATLALHRCATVAGFNAALFSIVTAFGNDSVGETARRAAVENHDVEASWLVGKTNTTGWRTSHSIWHVPNEVSDHLVANDCDLAAVLGELTQRATFERLIAMPFGSMFADV